MSDPTNEEIIIAAYRKVLDENPGQFEGDVSLLHRAALNECGATLGIRTPGVLSQRFYQILRALPDRERDALGAEISAAVKPEVDSIIIHPPRAIRAHVLPTTILKRSITKLIEILGREDVRLFEIAIELELTVPELAKLWNKKRVRDAWAEAHPGVLYPPAMQVIRNKTVGAVRDEAISQEMEAWQHLWSERAGTATARAKPLARPDREALRSSWGYQGQPRGRRHGQRRGQRYHS